MINYDQYQNLADMFFDVAGKTPRRPFLWAKHHGRYKALNWREVADQVNMLSRGLRAVGVQPGDRVMLVAENRPKWLIADFGIMAAGAICVPAYTTHTVDDLLYMMNHATPKIVIVSNKQLAGKVLQAAGHAKSVELIITMDEVDLQADLKVQIAAWNRILEKGASRPDDVRDYLLCRGRQDTACLIYTSGTGGAPKGVMLPHRALFHNLKGAYDLLRGFGLGREVFLSFLPLSHSYEHMAGHFFPTSIGAEIYYAEGTDSLARNLVEARPTIMTSVPRVYEVFHHKITQGVKRAGGLKEKLFNDAVELGRLRFADPARLSFAQKFYNKVLDLLVRRKVRKRFGGRLKAMVSGGAPLNHDVGMFFTALGLRILQGYGQTESAPIISCNRPGDVKIHTVGKLFKGVELKIADDGEILVRGDLVMQGYWGDPEATAQTIRDGWLHTGDIGMLDEDGHLVITDRKKDIIVNSGGDNISPQRVEGYLSVQPEIAQAAVFGDQKPYLVGLIVPDAEVAKNWARQFDKPTHLETLLVDPDFVQMMAKSVDQVNKKLSQIEKVRKFHLVVDPFSVDNEMMTPTMKIKRFKVREKYGDVIESLYNPQMEKKAS